MRIKYAALLSGVLAAVTGLTGQAQAADEYKGFQAGDILVRARGVWVAPHPYTTFVSGAAAGGVVDASDSFIPEIDASYFFTKNIAVEAIAGTTRHHITTSHPNLDLGHVQLLPPTVTAQWHFLPNSVVNPYLGAGLTYAIFFGEKSGATGLNVRYSNSWDPALQAGADVHLTGNWYANVDVKQLFISTTANVSSGAAAARVNLNPTLVGVGVGYKF